MQIVELGNQKVQLQEKPSFYPYTNFFIDVDNVIKWDNKSPNLPDLTAQVLFRTSFVGDRTTARMSRRGRDRGLPEVQLQRAGDDLCAGHAGSLGPDAVRASPLTGDCLGEARSNTVAVLYSEASFGGTQPVTGANRLASTGLRSEEYPVTPAQPRAADLHRLVELRELQSLWTRPHRRERQRGGSPRCEPVGRDVEQDDPARGQKPGRYELRRSEHHLQRLLRYRAGVVDLTQTELFTATFSPDISSCRSNFSNTQVDVATLNPAALRLLDLTHATITLSAPLPAGRPEWGPLARATVTGAGPCRAPISRTLRWTGTLRGIDLRGVVLSGATLNGANLTGTPSTAAISGRGFQGATLLDVTGFNTVVSAGADFTGAHFGGPGSSRPSSSRSPWTGRPSSQGPISPGAASTEAASRTWT